MLIPFLDNGQHEFDQADIIVAPIPFEGAISYLSGAALGPQAILKASHQVELYDFETTTDLSNVKFHTVECQPLSTLSEVRSFVSDLLKKINLDRQFYLGIGGDHTVTIPAIESLVHRIGKFGIVQIDAHADMRDTLHNDKFSHACIMRRIAEILGPENILSIGIRAVSSEEHDYIKQNHIKHIPGNHSLHTDLMPQLQELLRALPECVFLTVDLDGLDPTIMPHVGTPVPGGLSWYQTVSMIREVFRQKKVVSADVVEIASGPDSERSDFTAALLCEKIVASFVQSKGKIRS